MKFEIICCWVLIGASIAASLSGELGAATTFITGGIIIISRWLK